MAAARTLFQGGGRGLARVRLLDVPGNERRHGALPADLAAAGSGVTTRAAGDAVLAAL
jgi:hypothetical protein